MSKQSLSGDFNDTHNIKFRLMLLNYLIAIVASLKGIGIGTMLMKLKASAKLGVLLSPLVYILDRLTEWGIDNQDYILLVMGAIAFDHALGSAKHAFVLKDFTFRKNIEGLITKIGLVVACGFLFEATNIIIKKDSVVTDYLTIVTRLMVFMYPAGSAFWNSSVLSGGKFPPKSWLDKLTLFQSNLNPDSLTKKQKK